MNIQSYAIWQFVFLYSVYQAFILGFIVLSMLFSWHVSPWVLDVIRANCVMIAIAWLLLYLITGPSAIANYYETRYVPDTNRARMMVRGMDVLIHFIPVIVLGLPKMSTSIVFALGFMAFWYIATRPFLLHFIQYVPIRMIDVLLYMLYPFVVFMLLVCASYKHQDLP